MTEGEDAGEPALLRINDGGLVTLQLNRPRQFNALSEGLLAALKSELDDIAADDGVRCVVIAAAAERQRCQHRRQGRS